MYVYSVMSGGPTGTQAWTFFGIKDLTDLLQVFRMATYTLPLTGENGDSWFYAPLSFEMGACFTGARSAD